MKTNYTMLLLILLIGVVLICGCTTTKLSSDCTLYDGTWTGSMSDSGSLLVTRFTNSGTSITNNPFTASYDFEMTIKCNYSGKDIRSYDISRVKASHPIFECAGGCTPKKDGQSYLQLLPNGYGKMAIVFPNGSYNKMFSYDNSLQVDPEGKKMMLYISGTSAGSIGSYITADLSQSRDVETYNCMLGGNGSCLLQYINKNTIILNKVN